MGEKDDLAGPPLPPIRDVALPSAALDMDVHSGRYKAGDYSYE
jgi:hypothetical protein